MSRAKPDKGVMDRDYRFEYHGLLHAMKDLAIELKRIRDVLPDPKEIDRYISFMDREFIKHKETKYG